MQPTIEIKNLSKRYQSVQAIDHLTLTINQGEIFGLLGPNGAGKTTTLECLEGIRSPDSGEITVFGLNPGVQEHSVRSMMGVQLQNASLPEYILSCEAMELVSRWHGVPFRSDLLSPLLTADEAKKQYRQLSTGQKRRLHLALALVGNPRIVVLDEPTAGLDVTARALLHNKIRALKRSGVTVLLATHDMAEAETLCDRIAILIQGKLAIVDSPAELTAQTRQKYRLRIATVKNTLINETIDNASLVEQQGHYGIWHCDNPETALLQILEKVKTSDDQIIDLRVERPSLEEVFLSYIEGVD